MVWRGREWVSPGTRVLEPPGCGVRGPLASGAGAGAEEAGAVRHGQEVFGPPGAVSGWLLRRVAGVIRKTAGAVAARPGPVPPRGP